MSITPKAAIMHVVKLVAKMKIKYVEESTVFLEVMFCKNMEASKLIHLMFFDVKHYEK